MEMIMHGKVSIWKRERGCLLFQDIIVISLGYGLDDREFESRHGVEIYVFTTVSRPSLGPIQWVPEALSLVIKRPGREAYHSSPSNTEVNNA
jgi:hypothetical protein